MKDARDRFVPPSWAVWPGIIVTMIAAVWFLNWNEYESPWGRDIQAWKIEHLKKTLCN